MNDKDKILAIDLINFKKLSILLTGKSFNLRADRGFGSKEKEVEGLLSVIEEWKRNLEKKSNPADDVYNGFPTRIGMTSQDESSVISTEQKNKLLESTVPKKIEPQVAEDKIEYDILESFPFGIEKIEDYGKNKSLYFCEPDYYTRVVNEKAKHISYESAVNYLKSK